MKSKEKRTAVIRNVVEMPWQEFPGHFGGALCITARARKIAKTGMTVCL